MSDSLTYNAQRTVDALKTEKQLALHEGYALVRHNIENDPHTAERIVTDEEIKRWMDMDDEAMVQCFLHWYHTGEHTTGC